MKSSHCLIFGLMLLCIGLPACKENSNIPNPGDNSFNSDSPISVDTSSCTPVTIKEALVILDHMQDGATTTEMYKVSGIVSQNNTSPDDIPNKYTNINFTIKDEATNSTLACWYTNNINNRPFTATTQVPLVGSKLTVIGPLCRYVDKSGNVKPEMTNGFICRIDSMIAKKPVGPWPTPTGDTISVTKALEIARQLQTGATSPEKYYVMGVISQVDDFDDHYGNTTFYITENNKQSLQCYHTLGLNGKKLTSIEQTQMGDTVIVYGNFKNYNGTLELNQGSYIVRSTNPLLK